MFIDSLRLNIIRQRRHFITGYQAIVYLIIKVQIK